MNNLVLICAIFPVLFLSRQHIRQSRPVIRNIVIDTMRVTPSVTTTDTLMCKTETVQPMHVWVTVKGGVMDITMDSVWVTVALIFSMGKGVTKVLT